MTGWRHQKGKIRRLLICRYHTICSGDYPCHMNPASLLHRRRQIRKKKIWGLAGETRRDKRLVLGSPAQQLQLGLGGVGHGL